MARSAGAVMKRVVRVDFVGAHADGACRIVVRLVARRGSREIGAGHSDYEIGRLVVMDSPDVEITRRRLVAASDPIELHLVPARVVGRERRQRRAGCVLHVARNRLAGNGPLAVGGHKWRGNLHRQRDLLPDDYGCRDGRAGRWIDGAHRHGGRGCHFDVRLDDVRCGLVAAAGGKLAKVWITQLHGHGRGQAIVNSAGRGDGERLVRDPVRACGIFEIARVERHLHRPAGWGILHRGRAGWINCTIKHRHRRGGLTAPRVGVDVEAGVIPAQNRLARVGFRNAYRRLSLQRSRAGQGHPEPTAAVDVADRQRYPRDLVWRGRELELGRVGRERPLLVREVPLIAQVVLPRSIDHNAQVIGRGPGGRVRGEAGDHAGRAPRRKPWSRRRGWRWRSGRRWW